MLNAANVPIVYKCGVEAVILMMLVDEVVSGSLSEQNVIFSNSLQQ